MSGRGWGLDAAGVVTLAFDVVLAGAVVAGTTGLAVDALAAVGLPGWSPAVTVPGYVYLYGVLGAVGFVFTRLVRADEAGEVALLRANLRLPAALPLAAGLYLFADRLVGTGAAPELLAGLAFLAGLFVNTTYYRIHDLAVRLLSPGGGAGAAPDDDRDRPEQAADADTGADGADDPGRN